MRIPFVRFLCVPAILIAVACGSKNPAAPDTAGTWRGTTTDSGAGPGTIEIVLTQAGPGVDGTWSASYQSGSTAHGTVGGSVNGSALSLMLSPASPIVCSSSISLSGTLAVQAKIADGRMTGSYVVLACVGTVTGTIDVTRAP